MLTSESYCGRRGLYGSTENLFTVLLTQRLGVTTFLNLLTAGTLSASLAQDQFGAFGGTRRPTTALRVAAVALSFVGSLLTQDSAAALPGAKSTRSQV